VASETPKTTTTNNANIFFIRNLPNLLSFAERIVHDWSDHLHSITTDEEGASHYPLTAAVSETSAASSSFRGGATKVSPSPRMRTWGSMPRLFASSIRRTGGSSIGSRP